VPAWRRRLTGGLTVFIFHEVTDTPSGFHRAARSYTSRGVFRAQVGWIAKRFEVIEATRLRQLGGSHALPPNAALITFDDSWAGTFRTALPILREMAIPAICFLNMGTVAGDPDLAAASNFLAVRGADPIESRAPLDVVAGERLVEEFRRELGTDPAFLDYQGETATPEDLEAAVAAGNVWFGSHLYHHWRIPLIADDLFDSTVARNAEALSGYPNSIPALATPHGYPGEGGRDVHAIPAARGIRIVFTGTGSQNTRTDTSALDRVFFPAEPCDSSSWWYSTHRRRALGPRTS